MKQITTYKCESFTRAQDKANIVYIFTPAAREITHPQKGLFEVKNKTGKVLAQITY